MAGPGDGVTAAVDAELVVDRPLVGLDGVHRHREVGGDLGRGAHRGQALEDGALAIGQRLHRVGTVVAGVGEDEVDDAVVLAERAALGREVVP